MDITTHTDTHGTYRTAAGTWTTTTAEITIEAVEGDGCSMSIAASVTSTDELDTLIAQLHARRGDLATAEAVKGTL
jgi:hypothetical protein